jgi:hypothetical protein
VIASRVLATGEVQGSNARGLIAGVTPRALLRELRATPSVG